MKKTLLIALLVVAVLSSSFAARGSSTEIMLGLSSGFNQMVLFDDNGTSSTNIIPIKIDGMFYLGDSFALNTALGMDIILPEIESADAQMGFVADILAYYRMQLAKSVDILLGGGVSYLYFSPIDGMSSNSLDLLASLRFQFGITDHIVIFAGAEAGYKVLNAATIDLGVLGSRTEYGKDSIMPWAVKAGVSYKF